VIVLQDLNTVISRVKDGRGGPGSFQTPAFTGEPARGSGKTRPLIVPIFISHSGCPHRCVFCDQEQITSHSRGAMGADQVRETLKKATDSPTFDRGRNPEVAFYGGTFTGLGKEKMKELLEAASPFIEDGDFTAVRVSTRPDFIHEEGLSVMKALHVKTVELGVQSLDQEVLLRSRRGHTAGDVVRAVKMLKESGFRVGMQLMPGLPGDSRDRFLATVERVMGLDPHMVRLYPALVIRQTGLARMWLEGSYEPLTLEEAVYQCAQAVSLLERKSIPVIRIGLMISPSSLEKGRILAGPWHPAFGFLVRSAIYHQGIAPDLPAHGTLRRIRLYVREGEVPIIRGYKNRGIGMIEEKTGAKVLGIGTDNTLPPGRVRFCEL